MQFYKKAFLTLSVAGAMVSCAPVSLMTYPVQAKVIKKADFIYLDYDNDSIADARMYIRGDTVKNNQCYFKDYIMVGDTLKYRTTKDKPVFLSADLYRNAVLDSVLKSGEANLLLSDFSIFFKHLENVFSINLMIKTLFLSFFLRVSDTSDG